MSNLVKPGTDGAAIVSAEESLLARVSERVAAGDEPGEGSLAASDLDADLISLRDQIAEAKPEDLAPLVEQMTRLAALRGRVGGSRSLPVDTQSPYFGHMVLESEGQSKDVLIGKRGFIDRQSNVQIVDWRNAPISRIYYRYDEGDDYEEEIAGRKSEGIVRVRRNVSIHRAVLRRIGTPEGTYVRDARGAWHEAIGSMAPVLQGGVGKAARMAKPQHPPAGERGRLGVHHGPVHRADKMLPEIAALIDSEQFELISQPESGMVVIQGGAGSGKTTVALHRIAYLNFADSRRFRANNMLVVVPNDALARYVGGVLPSLGVNGVPVITYRSWAKTQRLKLVPHSPIRYNDEPPEVVVRIKKHPALLAILERYVADQAAGVETELAAISAKAAALWRESTDGAPGERLSRVARTAGREASSPAEKTALEGIVRRWRRRFADVLTDWSELLTDPVRLGEGFASQGVTDVSERDIARLVAWCSQQVSAPPEVTTDDEGRPVETADGAAVEDHDVPNGRLDHEDDPILLRLLQLKLGGLKLPNGDEVIYEHVAIDEAQDRSALEVKVLLDATRPGGPSGTERSVTIAGDTAQRLVFDNNFSGWADLLAQTGQTAVVRPLKLSYRSTAEVMALARDVLGPELAPDEPLAARSGAPVELHEFGDVGEAVAFLGDALRGVMGRERIASVAVVARYPEQADAYYEGLRRAEVPALRRVRREDFSFTPGIDVTDVTQVKGLEFDYVIMVDANQSSYPPSVEARHLMHIGMTRAAHQLWLISSDTPSALIPERVRFGGGQQS